MVLIAACTVPLGAAGVAQAASPDANLPLARAEAARLLALVPLPAQTAALPTDPHTGKRFAPPGPPASWQVLAAGHWLAPVPALTARSYMSAHQPPSATQTSVSLLGGTLDWGETLSFPTSGVAITYATLNISISPFGSGQAEIDAIVRVLWKPTWEQIPSSTRALTVSVDQGPAMVLTGEREIARFARLFSGLSNVEPDLPSCPAGFDPQTAAVKLTGARGRTIGTLTIDDLGDCNQVFVRLGRRRGAPVWDHGLLDLLWREGGVNTCRASQLTSTITRPPSNQARSIDIEMRNTSSIECSVDGYPSLRFDTPEHRISEIRLLRDRRQPKASLATAAPGGVLIITATWPERRPPCPTRTIESFTIGLPRIAGELHASTNGPVRICAGPITTSPVFNPGPFSAAYELAPLIGAIKGGPGRTSSSTCTASRSSRPSREWCDGSGTPGDSMALIAR